MPVGAIAAGISGVATVAGAGIQANAAGNAADEAAQAAAANNALQLQIYNENKGELSPYINRGNAAGSAESALLGLGGNKAAAAKAFGDYLGSTGYTFQKNQGISAITGNRAASGVLDSGGTLKGVEAYGQGIGANYFQTYLSNLSGMSGQGLTGAAALAGVGENFANQSSLNNTNAANTAANAGLSTASNISSLLGQGANAFGTYLGASSFNNPATAGAAAGGSAGTAAGYAF